MNLTWETIPKRIHRPRFNRESSSIRTKNSYVYAGMLPVGFIFLIGAILTGLWRISLIRGTLNLPPLPEWLPPHGHLILGGFLALLIMWERMIALNIPFLFWIPYAYALSAALLHTQNRFVQFVHILSITGWVLHRFLAARIYHHWQKPALESGGLIVLSAAMWAPGGLAAGPVAALAGFSFALGSILAERLELGLKFKKRLALRASECLILWYCLLLIALWFSVPGISMLGVTLLLLLVITAASDLNLKSSFHLNGPSELHRFLGVGLKTAYLWLGLSAMAMIFWSHLPPASNKDIVIHLMGLGFVFSMMLAHAPLIMPAALRLLPPERPQWIWFLVFQSATLIRIAGDISIIQPDALLFWSWSGLISGMIHLFSFVGYVVATFRSIRMRVQPA